MPKKALFRFYEELNDFLPKQLRKTAFHYDFNGRPSVKDAIEAIGVPHTEIDLILVNGGSVDFAHRLSDGEFVSVYPVFESIDISPVIRLRPHPLREPRFILDVHLGRLAARLRLLGFDTVYDTNCDDNVIIALAAEERRIILTRDISLLRYKSVTHGYWVRSVNPFTQTVEVMKRFDLAGLVNPFSRCINCNGVVETIPKEAILDRLQQKTAQYYDEFTRCAACGNIYWKGSHHIRMTGFVDRILGRLR
jgi:uncharacterized protein with PIN domain